MFDTTPSITIIGFGAFGQLVARLLAPHADVSVFDPQPTAREAARQLGLRVHDALGAVSTDIVILAVPVPALAACLTQLAPHLREGQLVVDVCSIKEGPARLMRQLLPEKVDILATHPMFGPQSAQQGIAGCQVVLCPVRGAGWRRLGAFLRKTLALDVIVTTPEDHDRQAAMTQGLTHLLARALSNMGEKPRIRSRSFDLMSEALALVANDAPEVFEAITRGNRHVLPLCTSLTSALSALVAIPEEMARGEMAAGPSAHERQAQRADLCALSVE